MRHAVQVQLPKSSALDGKDKLEELIVYVDKNNMLFFNNKTITKHELIKELETTINKTKINSLFIRADKHASWGTVLELFDSLRSVKGMEHVILPTQKTD